MWLSLFPPNPPNFSIDLFFSSENHKYTEKESFSDVILKYYPARKRLSSVLAEIGINRDLADSIESASQEMRQAKIRGVDL